jgi:hypothetical protein
MIWRALSVAESHVSAVEAVRATRHLECHANAKDAAAGLTKACELLSRICALAVLPKPLVQDVLALMQAVARDMPKFVVVNLLPTAATASLELLHAIPCTLQHNRGALSLRALARRVQITLLAVFWLIFLKCISPGSSHYT